MVALAIKFCSKKVKKVAKGCKMSQKVTKGHKKSQKATKSCKSLQKVAKDLAYVRERLQKVFILS